ncbi:hypothetical protein POX_c04487 [Penicillium oxalicum]|uniref:hypothetical protein n=1 Tax=Penicillium oxalicum TaxID=69781 RepID=UPI0020B8F55B|nr:hypothetical protein POX_c04487 [Penicillium oxalicum]KAI2791621.1 hypothetical protein POX_c04487 [Penicillium oxalicum]
MSVLLSAQDPHGPEIREKHASDASQHSVNSQAAAVVASKPSFHLTAPSGWMNDPCGLGYDPITRLYHIFFQWNPHGNDWGNMSWGHATSTDLVSWNVFPEPALTPSAEYDRCGVFTGCLQATDPLGSPGSLTGIYTSVHHLPLHYTLPYIPGCESLSLAVSQDGGLTWKRQKCNPILTGPPAHLSVTGWRDPHLTTWPAVQRTTPERSTPQDQDQFKGIVAGGIVGRTPAIFVYKVKPANLGQWVYTGLLLDLGLNFHPSRWSGDFGVNWEVSNLVTLANEAGDCREFAIMGAEGCLRAERTPWTTPGSAQYKRQARAQLWMCIRQRSEIRSDEVLADYAFSGHFDHGCLYAANSFWDPITSQRVVYGWITEEDLPDGPRHRQGWSGVISIPRVVALTTIRGVTKARSSDLKSITSIEIIPEDPFPMDSNMGQERQTYTIHTLGIKPDPRLSSLRKGAERKSSALASRLPVALRNSSRESVELATSRWEVQAEFRVNHSCEQVGIEITHSPDFQSTTTLSWSPSTETFTIHRPALQDQTINHGYESAPHTLFTKKNLHSHDDQVNKPESHEIEEPLQIHLFYDKSVLEVFVNDRTVISTRIYYPPQSQHSSSGECFGVKFFAKSTTEDESLPTTLIKAEVWDGLAESMRF